MTLRFAEITAPRPDKASLAAQHSAIDARLDAGDRAGALAAWDAARRDYDTWSSLVHLTFAQDTTDKDAVAAMAEVGMSSDSARSRRPMPAARPISVSPAA